MSYNYNIALLKTLKTPMVSSIDEVIGGLNKVNFSLGGALDFSKELKNINNVLGSLKMIGKHSPIIIIVTIKDGIKKIASSNDLGWDHIQKSKAIQSAIKLLESFKKYLILLNDGYDRSAVFLYHDILEMQKTLGLEESQKIDFFDIDIITPHGISFSALKKEKLKEISEVHQDKFDSSFKSLESILTQQSIFSTSLESKDKLKKVKGCLQSILEVYDWAYTLKHRFGYYGLWLACRARITWDVIQLNKRLNASPNDNVEDYNTNNLLYAVRLSSVELKKFSADYRKSKYDSVYQMLLPFLTPNFELEDLSKEYQVFEQLIESFQLHQFWKDSEPLKNNDDKTQNNNLLSDSLSHKLSEYLYKLEELWSEISGKGIFSPSGNQEKDFQQTILLIKSICENIDNHNIKKMDKMTYELRSTFSSSDVEITENISKEVALLLVIFKELIVENDDSIVMDNKISLLEKRLNALIVEKDDNKYYLLPKLTWDEKKLSHKQEKAISSIIKKLLIYLNEIEEVFDEYFNLDIKVAKEKYKEIKDKVSNIYSILEVIKQDKALLLMSNIIDYIQILNDNEEHTENEIEYKNFVLSMTGLTSYLKLLEQSDAKAADVLEKALGSLNITIENTPQSLDSSHLDNSFTDDISSLFDDNEFGEESANNEAGNNETSEGLEINTSNQEYSPSNSNDFNNNNNNMGDAIKNEKIEEQKYYENMADHGNKTHEDHTRKESIQEQQNNLNVIDNSIEIEDEFKDEVYDSPENNKKASLNESLKDKNKNRTDVEDQKNEEDEIDYQERVKSLFEKIIEKNENLLSEDLENNQDNNLDAEIHKDFIHDEEIFNIFSEELFHISNNIRETKEQFLSGIYDSELINNLSRYYHTIKGSGRTCELWGIGEFYKKMEDTFNNISNKEISYSNEIEDLIFYSLKNINNIEQQLRKNGSFVIIKKDILLEEYLIRKIFDVTDVEFEVKKDNINDKTSEEKHSQVPNAKLLNNKNEVVKEFKNEETEKTDSNKIKDSLDLFNNDGNQKHNNDDEEQNIESGPVNIIDATSTNDIWDEIDNEMGEIIKRMSHLKDLFSRVGTDMPSLEKNKEDDTTSE